MNLSDLATPVTKSNLIRPGVITTVFELGLTLKEEPSSFPNLPILLASFSEHHFKMNIDAPRSMAHVTLVGDGPVPLAFQIQIGTSQLFWLADPTDPAVWDLLDHWAKAKFAMYAMDFNRRMVIAGSDYESIPPEIERLRRYAGENHAGAVAKRAIDIIATGALAVGATSKIPLVPKVRSVEACLLATPKLVSELNSLGMPLTNSHAKI